LSVGRYGRKYSGFDIDIWWPTYAWNARRPRNESAHQNSMGNLIPLTDQRPAYPGQTIAGGRVGGLDEKQTEVQRG